MSCDSVDRVFQNGPEQTEPDSGQRKKGSKDCIHDIGIEKIPDRDSFFFTAFAEILEFSCQSDVVQQILPNIFDDNAGSKGFNR